MTAKSRNLLEFPSSLLKMIGQHPETEWKKFAAHTALYSFFNGILIFNVFMQFFYTEGSIPLFVENFQTFALFSQTLAKVVLCAKSRKVLLEVIQGTKKFWKTEKNSKAASGATEKIALQIWRIQRFFVLSLSVTTISTEIAPFLIHGLPLGLWLIKGHDFLYITVLVIQEMLIPILVVHAAALDGFFLGFCGDLIVQFRLLQNTMKNLTVSAICSKKDKKEYKNSIEECIRHHAYLLKFASLMRALYSPIMFVECASLVIEFVAELFILLDSKDSLRMILQLLIAISDLVQLAFYCIPIDYVVEEAGAVSRAIYESDWYSGYYPTVKRTIPFIIQRAQKAISFTAGGLFEVNCRAFLAVLKGAWSVCMVMRAIKKT